MDRRELLKVFDKLAPHTECMMERGIATHRRGLFAVRVLVGQGNGDDDDENINDLSTLSDSIKF